MLLAFVEGGDGCEEQVEVAIDDSHLEGEQEDDRREEEHFNLSDYGAEENLAGREARVELRANVRLVGFFAEAHDFSADHAEMVGFAHADGGEGHDSGLCGG